VPKENFLVVTNGIYKEQVLEHIPELQESQILCEPIGRNTAPCIAYATYMLKKINPEASMIVTPADHLILNQNDFLEIIQECLDFSIQNNALMTVGIKPTRPDTGYGYIQKSNNDVISRVKCFTEKPALEIAQAFVDCGEFVWNSGLFVWSIDSIMRAFETYLPEHHALFNSADDALGTEREAEVIEQVFAECKSISIDYGVMEKAENVYVRCSDFGWSDVGTWGSVYQLSQKDRNENMLSHDGCYAYDTSKSIVSVADGKVAVIKGLSNYIVVDTDDVLLVCPRSDEQSIKKYIDDVRFDKGEKYV
jgi:mannose-1-phosphate guanylyltransferase